MTRQTLLFSKAAKLDALIAQYFQNNSGEMATVETTAPGAKIPVKKIIAPAYPTISGLALSLGFDSRQAFEAYEAKGKFGRRLKRARLRIEEFYEKKLHTQYTSGAIFALKNLGWNDRGDKANTDANITVSVVQAGPQLAGAENDVVL